MKKYREMEKELNKNFKEVKEYVDQLDQEMKKALEINEEHLKLIKNCSLEQLQEMNKR